MNPRLGLFVAVSSALVIIAACGGGDALSLEEYLQALDGTEDDAGAADEKAIAAYDEALESAETEEEAADALRKFLDDEISTVQLIHDDLGSLAPPADVEDLHNDATAARADVLEILADLSRRAELADSVLDVEALVEELVEGPEFLAVGNAAQDAVCKIQEIGIEKGFEVDDIGCEE